MRGIVVSFVSPTTKRAGRRNRRRHQAPKKSLRLPKSKLGNSGNDLLHRPMTPRPVQRGGGVKVLVSSRRRKTSVLRVRANCGGQLFTA